MNHFCMSHPSLIFRIPTHVWTPVCVPNAGGWFGAGFRLQYTPLRTSDGVLKIMSGFGFTKALTNNTKTMDAEHDDRDISLLHANNPGGEPSRRAPQKRASKACLSCRARKVRCDVTASGVPCMNCRLDHRECIVGGRSRK
jgi:hypothetical protein